MTPFMATRLHPGSAVLFLLTLYALAGLLYAAFQHSGEAVAIWAIVAVTAAAAGALFQARVTSRRRVEKKNSD